METVAVSNREAVLEELERVLSSAEFQGAERAIALLRYVVEQTLDGRADRLKEYAVGVEALGRGSNFDPRIDPIVRAEASRLRSRLERYYRVSGSGDPVLISLPKGSYAPVFTGLEKSAPVAAAHSNPEPSEPRLSTDNRSSIAAWLAALCLLGLAAFLGGLWLGRGKTGTPAPSFAQFDVELGSGGRIGSEVGTDIVISRDGSRVAFVVKDSAGVPRLGTRLFKDANSVELPGTEGARAPFFSPDGRWIGFWSVGKLKKVAVDRGWPVVLCDASDLLGASWADDGTIIGTLNSSNVLWRVPAAGGTPTSVLDLSAEGLEPRWAQALPGSNVLYTALRGPNADRGDVEILSLRTGKRTMIVRGGTFARYLRSGHIAYINQGSLYVVPFDLASMERHGAASPVLDGIAYSQTFGYAQIDFSDVGTVVYRKAPGSGQSIAVWLDSTGAVQPLVDVPGRYAAPRLAPNGRRLAMSVVDGGILTLEFYEQSRGGGRAARMSMSAPQFGMALWTPDSRYILMNGTSGTSWMRDSGAPQPLLSTPNRQVAWTFSPGGDRLAYYEMNPTSAFDLWTVPISVDAQGVHAGTPEVYLRTPAYEVYPSFSPDGRWMAYSSNESGSWEVYVRHFPDDGSKVQVSRGGGRVPRWSSNGRDLFYGTDDQRLMIARYTTQAGTFAAGMPRAWTALRLADTGVLPNYDLAPDGRVVALVAAGASTAAQRQNHATVLLGFFDELRRRAATAVR